AVLLAFKVFDWLYFQRNSAMMMTIITPPAAMTVVLRAGIQLALFIMQDFVKANVHKPKGKSLKSPGGNSKMSIHPFPPACKGLYGVAEVYRFADHGGKQWQPLCGIRIGDFNQWVIPGMHG